MQRRKAKIIGSIRTRRRIDQPPRHSMMPAHDGQQQRRPSAPRPAGWPDPAFKEKIDKINVPVARRQMQRRQPVPVNRMNIRTTCRQPFGLQQIAVLRRLMQEAAAERIAGNRKTIGAKHVEKNGQRILHDKTRRPQEREKTVNPRGTAMRRTLTKRRNDMI